MRAKMRNQNRIRQIEKLNQRLKLKTKQNSKKVLFKY